MKSRKVKNYLYKSFSFFKDVKFRLIILTIFYLFLAFLGFLIPIIEAHMITSITSGLFSKVIYFALGYLILRIVESTIIYVSDLFWQKKIKTKVLFRIRKYLIDKIMSLKLVNFDKYGTGYYAERLKTDPEAISNLVSDIQEMFTKCINRIGIIIYIMVINWVLGLIYVGGILLITIYNWYVLEVVKEKKKKIRKSDEEVSSFLSEIIRGIRDIKLLNFHHSIKKNILSKLDDNNNKNMDRALYMSKTNEIVWIIFVVVMMMVVILGIKFVQIGKIDSANLVVLYLYSGQLFSLVYNFTYLKSAIKDYEVAIERVFAFDDLEKHPEEKFGSKKIKNFKGKIEFKNVSFGYKNNKRILNKFNLLVNPKDTVALIGASGAGKTTVFNLITKSYEVDEGTILLDDVDIKELDEDTIRKNVSIITQNPYIFNMSIEDNLKLVKPNATQKEIDKVCKEACFYDFVMSLPEKYDTLIGEGGLNLSGGQRQRIAIARALLKDCKILLFDEATSALDNITQQEIQTSINNISKDYTIIIVAHRLSTIINCKLIYLLDKGKILDYGSHQELLKRNKKYQKMYRLEL